jgi:RimJ/RimL family protein N-acetyltransferase
VNEHDRAVSPEGLTIRPLAAADRSALAKLPDRISRQSAIARFHGAISSLSEPLLDHLLNLEAGQREAVVAIDERGIVGVARYARDSADSDTAEVAILVADEWQHHGVAHQMLRPLIAQALQAGITRFRADMLQENIAARRLFAELAPTVNERFTSGHVVVTIDLLGFQ